MDNIIVQYGMPWSAYEGLRLGNDSPGVRLAFNQGILEIMSPSRRHELVKTMIGRVLEAFCDARGIALSGFGSMTMTNREAERALEPDECYVLGDDDGQSPPDFAVEVVLSNRAIDKLPIYASLGVREVWYWCNGQFAVFERDGDGWRQIANSQLLPGLNLEAVARLAERKDQAKAIAEFRASLLGG